MEEISIYLYQEYPTIEFILSNKSKEFYGFWNLKTEGFLEWVTQDDLTVDGSEICRQSPKVQILTQIQAR